MDILSGWQIPSSGRSENISFETAAVQEEVCIWRSDLPADAGTAEMQLGRAEDRVIAVRNALDEVPGRIENLVKRASAQRQGGVAFGSAGLRQPEAGLLLWLAEESGGGALAYGLDFEPDLGWQNARQEFQRELERVLKLVTYLAWVETQVEGRWVGRSMLRWSGDMDTLWQAKLTPEQARLHRRSLAVAVASRNFKLRVVMLTAQNAAKLATLLATPAGVVLAIPAIWKFIDQVLAEVEQYQTIKGQGHE